jgi:hypothetical protein
MLTPLLRYVRNWIYYIATRTVRARIILHCDPKALWKILIVRWWRFILADGKVPFMSKGQQVRVKLYGGSTALRRVVEVKRDVIVICAEEEYQQAQLEGRQPSGLGFPRADVIDRAESRNAAQ